MSLNARKLVELAIKLQIARNIKAETRALSPAAS
jgi:hypothetical protein